MSWLKNGIGALFEGSTAIGSTATAFGRAKLQIQYETLKRKILLLHLIVLVNGLTLAAIHSFHVPRHLSVSIPGLLFGASLLRLAYWIRELSHDPAPEEMLDKLKRTVLTTILLCIGFSAWALTLFEYGDTMHKAFTAVLAFMSSLASAYCLGALPRAARSAIYLVGMPIAVRLLFSGDILLVAIGLDLFFISLIALRMLDGYYTSLVGLIESREEVIAEKKRALSISRTDALTGLANRRALTAAVDQRVNCRDNLVFAIAIIDLDGFKPINDTYGHSTGDEVLKKIAARLDDLCSGRGLVARLGGDEFVMLIDDISDERGCRVFGETVCQLLAEPIRVGGSMIRISACCGFALYPQSGADGNLLIDRADTALYHCKRTKCEQVAVFRMDLENHLRRRMNVEQSLRAAIANSRIDMAFQPIFDLETGELISFEALARWHDPKIGQVSPLEFITAAEQIGVITELTNRLLDKALTSARSWDESVSLSFNISAVQIADPATGVKILAALNEKGMAPRRFNIEITETALLTDFESARKALHDLRSAGVKVYIDDFGTGQSSLEYLRAFAFDMVKVDQTFIQSIAGPAEEQKLLRGIRDLCSAIDVPCIAEGIETDHQKDILRQLGFRYGQGNGLHPPVSAEEAAAMPAGSTTAGRERILKAG